MNRDEADQDMVAFQMENLPSVVTGRVQFRDGDWYDGFRAAIRAVREQTGGGYDAEVEREATAQRMEDALIGAGGRVTAACEPPKKAPARTPS